MVYLGPRWRGAFRPRLHNPPPGYRPPKPRISLKERQRQARQNYILLRAATIILVPVTVALAVIIFLIIAAHLAPAAGSRTGTSAPWLRRHCAAVIR